MANNDSQSTLPASRVPQKITSSKLIDKSNYLSYSVYTIFVYMNALDDVEGFDWDKANMQHIALHAVMPDETEEVFFDPKHVISNDVKHSRTEKRFIIIGKTDKGRLLYQVFTKRGRNIRIISSRDINRKEVLLYEKKTSRSKI